MTLNEVIELIQTWIVENGNEEITADVLRPILEAMVNQPNDLIGDLDNLTTTDKDNLVEAINEVRSLAITNAGIVIHSGSGTPSETPPVSVGLGDFYAQVIFPSTSVVSFWQYNGSVWVEQRPQRTRTLLKFVSLVGVTVEGKSQVQWMADAINLNISNGAVYECEPGDIIDFFVNTINDVGSGTPVINRIFTRLTTGATSVTTVTANDLMPDGFEDVPIDEELIVELGDIGSDDVWDAFNADADQPFEMDNEMFVSAIQDGENKLWQWIGGTGTFGSTETPAVESDFLDLTLQPEVTGNQNNIIKIVEVLDTDLDTLDADGLATYYNELDPGVMKDGFESWIVNIVDDGDEILKSFILVNRGKGPVGVEAIADNPANTLTAEMFFEINIGRSTTETIRAVATPPFEDIVINSDYYIFTATEACTIISSRITVATAPTGADIEVILRKNGSDVGSTNMVVVATATVSNEVTYTSQTLAIGDVVAIRATQIGSTIAGENILLKLTIQK